MKWIIENFPVLVVGIVFGFLMSWGLHTPVPEPVEQTVQRRIEKSGAKVDNFIQARQVGNKLYVAIIRVDDMKCFINYTTMGLGINQDCYKNGESLPSATLRQDWAD